MSGPIDVDLCGDCVFVDANGTDDLPPDWSWAGFLPEWSGWMFGAIRCGGEDVDDLWCEGHFVAPGRSCDGCGDPLGGVRFCYTAFLPGQDPGSRTRLPS